MRSLIRVIAVLNVQNHDTVVYPSFLRTFAPGVRHLVYIFIDGGRFTGQCHGDGLWATNIFSLFSSPGAINLSFFSACQKPETSCMHVHVHRYFFVLTHCAPTLLRGAAYFCFNDIIIQSNTVQCIAPPTLLRGAVYLIFFNDIIVQSKTLPPPPYYEVQRIFSMILSYSPIFIYSLKSTGQEVLRY